MKETGIIFSTDMVRAILDDRKTQTRRVIKPTKQTEWLLCSDWDDSYIKDPGNFLLEHCPYGQVGDKLYCRETWAVDKLWDDTKPSVINSYASVWFRTEYRGDWVGKTRPSIFMPKWAAHIWLEITEVRVEKLVWISEGDAMREGVCTDPKQWDACFTDAFLRLWDSLNAKRGYGWETNCWVWVLSFKVINK